jgi:hypothetical protein
MAEMERGIMDLDIFYYILSDKLMGNLLVKLSAMERHSLVWITGSDNFGTTGGVSGMPTAELIQKCSCFSRIIAEKARRGTTA